MVNATDSLADIIADLERRGAACGHCDDFLCEGLSTHELLERLRAIQDAQNAPTADEKPRYDPALSFHRYRVVLDALRCTDGQSVVLADIHQRDDWTWSMKTLANDTRTLAKVGVLDRRVVRTAGRKAFVWVKITQKGSEWDESRIMQALRAVAR